MSNFISQTSEDLAFLLSSFKSFLSLHRTGTGKRRFGGQLPAIFGKFVVLFENIPIFSLA